MWEMVKGISKVPVQRRKWVISGGSDGEHRALNRQVRLGLEGPFGAGEGDFVLSLGNPCR